MSNRISKGRATGHLERYRRQDTIRACNIALEVVSSARAIRRRLRLIRPGDGIMRRDAASAEFPIVANWETLDLLTIVADMESDRERRLIARRARTVVLHFLIARSL